MHNKLLSHEEKEDFAYQSSLSLSSLDTHQSTEMKHVGQQKQIMPPFEDKNSQPHDNRVTFLNSIRVKITAVHKNNMPNKKTLDQINVGLSAQLRCISLHFSSQIHYKQKYPASLFQMMRKTRP